MAHFFKKNRSFAILVPGERHPDEEREPRDEKDADDDAKRHSCKRSSHVTPLEPGSHLLQVATTVTEGLVVLRIIRKVSNYLQ